MACSLFRSLRRVSHLSLLTISSLNSPPLLRSGIFHSRVIAPAIQPKYCCMIRKFSNGSVNLVISQGKAKFEAYETDPPKKEKWLTKKRLKLQRKRDKKKRAAANKRDPRHLGITGKKKQKFANAEERIKYKLEKAQIKEAMLIERLKRYEVPKAQGPVVKPNDLTSEERFYLKKMAQKGSNYAPVGRRGIFGGVILNMHMHWKKHETVKVFCKPCKPGQVQEYAREIARLSGGIPIQIIGNDTIIFYRGKNYVQPEVMSPIDTLSKKRALEKSKYEQSLECVRRFIAIANKELELYYRHVALYGDTNNRNPIKILGGPRKYASLLKENEEHKKRLSADSNVDGFASSLDMNSQSADLPSSEAENDSEDVDEDEPLLEGESDFQDDNFCNDMDSCEEEEEEEESFQCVENIPNVIFEMPSMFDGKQLEDSNNNDNYCK